MCNERSRMPLLGEETTGHREAALAGQHSFATAAAHAHEAAVHTMVRFPHVLFGRSVALYLFSAANQVSFLQWHLPSLEVSFVAIPFAF